MIGTHISPSLICMDLCNLERDVRLLEAGGIRLLHVDIVDGYFSPSMPMGLDVIRQVRKKTDLLFDAHVMAVDNDFFLNELLDIGVHRICFQAESERHIARKLSMIRNRGARAGLALSPATPLSCLEYVLDLCDFVLLMMINPGFASFGGETRYDFMLRKIADLKAMIDDRRAPVEIELDGRVKTADLPDLMRAGAELFVAGTGCLFIPGRPLEENIRLLKAELDAMASG